jgi:hypothetical protein
VVALHKGLRLPQEHVLLSFQARICYVFFKRFVKLQKATISFVMSVRPFVCLEQLGSHWSDFHEMLYFSIFRKSLEKNSSLIEI